MKEAWKDVNGFEGLYQVSNTGKVRNAKGHVLNPSDNGKGYLRFSLSRGRCCNSTQYLHRLIAGAFIPNPDNLPEINHKDENKRNNNIDNLEWCTVTYNRMYGTRNIRSALGKRRKIKGIRLSDGSTLCFDGVVEAAKQGFNKSAVSNCLQGISKSSGGYRWVYV